MVVRVVRAVPPEPVACGATVARAVLVELVGVVAMGR